MENAEFWTPQVKLAIAPCQSVIEKFKIFWLQQKKMFSIPLFRFRIILLLNDMFFVFSNDTPGRWGCWSERRVGSEVQGHWVNPLESIEKEKQEKVRSIKSSNIICVRDSCSKWPGFVCHKLQVHLWSSYCVHCLWHNSWEALLVWAAYVFCFCYSWWFFLFFFSFPVD